MSWWRTDQFRFRLLQGRGRSSKRKWWKRKNIPRFLPSVTSFQTAECFFLSFQVKNNEMAIYLQEGSLYIWVNLIAGWIKQRRCVFRGKKERNILFLLLKGLFRCSCESLQSVPKGPNSEICYNALPVPKDEKRKKMVKLQLPVFTFKLLILFLEIFDPLFLGWRGQCGTQFLGIQGFLKFLVIRSLFLECCIFTNLTRHRPKKKEEMGINLVRDIQTTLDLQPIGPIFFCIRQVCCLEAQNLVYTPRLFLHN